MVKYILSIDSSSSSVEICLVNSSTGKVEYSLSEPINLYSPQKGWFEYDAEEIWSKQLFLMNQILEKVDKEAILGIGITNQRETIVAWDKETLKPICNAISWQDSRNIDFFKNFSKQERIIRNKTGLFFSEFFSVSKIDWILKNLKLNRDRVRFGTIDSWIIAKMTNGKEYLTDITNASRTMLMNLETEDWDNQLLQLFGICREMLPEIRSSGSYFGCWNDLPIMGVIADQQAALLAFGNHEGFIQCTFGTGLFVMKNIGAKRTYKNKTITTVAWKLKDNPTVYALEGGSFSCGNVLERLLKEGLIDRYDPDPHVVPVSIYLEPVNGKLWMSDSKNWKRSTFNVDLVKDKGDKIAKSFLNGLALSVKQLIDRFDSCENENIRIHISGNISNIDYLRKVQSLVLSRKLMTSCGGMHSIMGVSILVLLSKGLINWGDVDRWNDKNLLTHFYNNLYSLEATSLSSLWTHWKYYL